MPFTDEQKTEIAELLKTSLPELLTPLLKDAETRFGKMANGAALTAAEKAVKVLKDRLDGVPTAEALAETVKANVAEQLAAHTPPAGAGEGESEAAREAKKERDALLKRLAAMETEMKQKDIAQAEILTKQKKTEERQAISGALEKAGVKPALRPAALAMLIERGAVRRDDEGNILFQHKDKDGVVEDLPVEDGVKKWVATDEGKEYLPAKETGGSGGGGGRAPAGGKTQFEINKANMLAGLRGTG